MKDENKKYNFLWWCTKIERLEGRKNPRGTLPSSPQSVTEKVVVDREGDHWDLNAASSVTKFPFLGFSLKGDEGITRFSALDSKGSVRCFMLGCWFRWTEEDEPISLFKRKERAVYKKSSWCVCVCLRERERGVEWKWEREERWRMSKVGVGKRIEWRSFGVMRRVSAMGKKKKMRSKEK